MIHIRCDETHLQWLAIRHLVAIRRFLLTRPAAYREQLFQAIKCLRSLPVVSHADYIQAEKSKDWNWLQNLILADVPTLQRLSKVDEMHLGFSHFSDMYSQFFSNGPNTYLSRKYNAYSLINGLGLSVCPYCDEEYAEVLNTPGNPQRTAQLDHFFPKGQYRGLAMCFFNLIPVGANCNRLKRIQTIGKNPYEADIESCTRLFPDIAVGVNLSALPPEHCHIEFHSTQEMEENITALHLEARYKKHNKIAHRLLQDLQNYDTMKQQELLRDFSGLFLDDVALRRALHVELPEEAEWGQNLLTKLRHDILKDS